MEITRNMGLCSDCGGGSEGPLLLQCCMPTLVSGVLEYTCQCSTGTYTPHLCYESLSSHRMGNYMVFSNVGEALTLKLLMLKTCCLQHNFTLTAFDCCLIPHKLTDRKSAPNTFAAIRICRLERMKSSTRNKQTLIEIPCTSTSPTSKRHIPLSLVRCCTNTEFIP